MVPKSNITGLILAGGAGRRVDGRDKGLIPWRGKPLIAHVCDRLKPQIGELLVSCNRNHLSYKAYSDVVITDSRQDFQGPLAGMEAASTYVQTDFLVVVSCDMPVLPDDLVERLVIPLEGTEDYRPDISYAHDGLRAQYLCAAIRRECLDCLSRYLDEGNRAVRDWFESQHTSCVDFSDKASSFTNYNRLP